MYAGALKYDNLINVWANVEYLCNPRFCKNRYLRAGKGISDGTNCGQRHNGISDPVRPAYQNIFCRIKRNAC
jgi:hypothetical protein